MIPMEYDLYKSLDARRTMNGEVLCWICSHWVHGYDAQLVHCWWQKLYIMMTEVHAGHKKLPKVRADYETSIEKNTPLNVCKKHIETFCPTFMRMLNIAKIAESHHLNPNGKPVEKALNLMYQIDKSRKLEKKYFLNNAVSFLTCYIDIIEPLPSPPESEIDWDSEDDVDYPLWTGNSENSANQKVSVASGPLVPYVAVKNPRKIKEEPPESAESAEEESQDVIESQNGDNDDDDEEPPEKRHRIRFAEDVELLGPPKAAGREYKNAKERKIRQCDLCKQRLQTSEVVAEPNKLIASFCAAKDGKLEYEEARTLYFDETRLFICCQCLIQSAHTLARLLKVGDPKTIDSAQKTAVAQFFDELKTFIADDLVPGFLKKCKMFGARYWNFTEPRTHNRRRSNIPAVTSPPQRQKSPELHNQIIIDQKLPKSMLSPPGKRVEIDRPTVLPFQKSKSPTLTSPKSPTMSSAIQIQKQPNGHSDTSSSGAIDSGSPRPPGILTSFLRNHFYPPEILPAATATSSASRLSMEPCTSGSSGSSVAQPLQAADFHLEPEEPWKVVMTRRVNGTAASSGAPMAMRMINGASGSSGTSSGALRASGPIGTASGSSGSSRLTNGALTSSESRPTSLSSMNSTRTPTVMRNGIQKTSESAPTSSAAIDDVSSTTRSLGSMGIASRRGSAIQKTLETLKSPRPTSSARPKTPNLPPPPLRSYSCRSSTRPPQRAAAILAAPSPPQLTSSGSSSSRKKPRYRFCKLCGERRLEGETQSLKIKAEIRVILVYMVNHKGFDVNRAKQMLDERFRVYMCPHHRRDIATGILALFKVRNPDRIASASKDLHSQFVADARKVCPEIDADEYLQAVKSFVATFWND